MSELLKSVDARTRLAATNKLEILLFTLGTDAASGRNEMFGINIFKVREVLRTPPITRAPEMPAHVEGIVSLRGTLVPVVDLAKYAGISTAAAATIMIVTEFNGRSQAFLVEAVDTILRIDWSAMRVPPEMVTRNSGALVTAVTELPDGRLVMMMDVERVLSDSIDPSGAAHAGHDIAPLAGGSRTVLFADDSAVARKQISQTLDAMHVRHIAAQNGREAWEQLQRIAQRATASGKPIDAFVQLVLTDVEMPEMDGYMLTRRIKSDQRLCTLPVVMHSSLSGQSNEQIGTAVGVDAYVTKFEPGRLANTVSRLLA